MLVDVASIPVQSEYDRTALKPHLHITSPLGWLNDPCAPCYDPNSELYHLFYQCNPNGVEWGDMSWGHATSHDLVTWKFGPRHTKLEPDRKYDRDGVFTGCMAPIAPDGTMTIFYSSICKLPFHWTSPAPRGSAGLAMATSKDEGKTWTKSNFNPILKEEPEGIEATGFRDPYLAEWATMDKIRGKTSLYGLISGGIQGSGPTTFMYAVDHANLTNWEYLGPLIDMPERYCPSTKWDCHYGMNWECVNFMTFTAGLKTQDVLILGSEGDVQREHLLPQQRREGNKLFAQIAPRAVRAQQWMAGNLVEKGTTAQMKYQYGGILDHGVYYAANSFHDPKTNRRIVYGWIPEDDCTIEFTKAKGWNGCQALPREIWLKSIPNITKAIQSPLQDITCMEFAEQPNGKFTGYTLGIKPIDELTSLRDTALRTLHHPQPFTLSPNAKATSKHIATTASAAWELTSSISLPKRETSLRKINRVGFHIRSSQSSIGVADNENEKDIGNGDDNNTNRNSSATDIKTTISFSPRTETISVVRTDSVPKVHETDQTDQQFNTCTEQGPFTLFTTRSDPIQGLTSSSIGHEHATPKRDHPHNQNHDSTTRHQTGEHDHDPKPESEPEPKPDTGREQLESLELRIISDGDVLEIFANDRFALATMVYTDPSHSTITAFVEYNDSDPDSDSADITTTTHPNTIPSNTTTNERTHGETTARTDTSFDSHGVRSGFDGGINPNHDLSGFDGEEEEGNVNTVVFRSVNVWDGLGSGMRYVGYEKGTIPEEIIERRASKV